MVSLVKHRWATGFSLLRRISDIRSTRNCGDRKFGSRMMSTAVNSTPSSSRVISPPWLMLPPVIEEGGDMVYKFYNLSEDKEESFRKKRNNSDEEIADDDAELVGSSHGWLALFNQRNNNHLFLYNPITRRHIKLPPIETLHDPMINFTPNGRGSVSKLVLSSSPDDDDDECIAMMIFSRERRLAFCNPCRSTEWTPIGKLFFKSKWGCDLKCENRLIVYPMNYGRAYEDFVYCVRPKRFTCITQFEIDLFRRRLKFPTCELEDWDFSDPHSPVSTHSSHGDLWTFGFEGDGEWINQNSSLLDKCMQIPYLVFSEERDHHFIVIRFVMDRVAPNGSYVHIEEIPFDPISQGLLVDAYPYKTIGFCVLKVSNPQKDGWRMVREVRLVKDSDSLDGLTIFIGMNHSFAVSSADFPNLKPNSIYFTDANKHDNSFYGGHDIGIFDYANKTFSDCYYPCVDIPSLRKIAPSPMWFTPSLYY